MSGHCSLDLARRPSKASSVKSSNPSENSALVPSQSRKFSTGYGATDDIPLAPMEDYMESYAREHDLDLDWMDSMLPEEGARKAVFLISDALHGRHTIHPRDTFWADKVYYLQLELQPVFTLMAWAYVCLSFFEVRCRCRIGGGGDGGGGGLQTGRRAEGN